MFFVFYDFETSGLETAFDQILQFAAIKTDDQFNEVDSINIRCRLLPHIVPSPGALRATRVRPAMLSDKTLPTHYEAIKQIRAKFLDWSPATFIGFNSISFDEDLLRQALFQTLHPAYLTNTNGNTRADILRIANAAHVYGPNKIEVPINEKGKESFRLEDLAKANGFDTSHAHDALFDVKMTISLAKLMKERAPDVWTAMLRMTRRRDAEEFILSQPMLSLTERHYGRTASYLVTPCGVNANVIAAFDLTHDPADYLNCSTEELVEVLKGKKRVFRSIRTNAQPIVMPADKAPKPAKAPKNTMEELTERAKMVFQNKEFHKKVGEALALQYADQEPKEHIEQRLYDGFPCKEDEVLMERFHLADWQARLAILATIQDERIREFGKRLIYFESPETLSEADQLAVGAWIAARMTNTDEAAPWMTLKRALAEADELLVGAVDEAKSLLEETKVFLADLAKVHGV
jgi:exodeoxyribonuclease I